MKRLFAPLFMTMSFALAQWDNLPPARLTLAQATSGSSAAVSSQAVTTQPVAPQRTETALPPSPATISKANPPLPPDDHRIIDPLLDTRRPKDCQLAMETEQTVHCGEITVVFPAGTYKQVAIVEGPGERGASDLTHLKPQQAGLGYIRYLTDTPIKVNGIERDGGLDIPVRKTDHLSVRIWYRKMKEPDTITKVFSFILPPIALVTGAGAWSSGNTLIPDSPPEFTEYRDYFIKPPKPALSLNNVPQPSHVRPLGSLSAPGASNLRSK